MFLHREAVEAVRDLHRLFVVGNHQDLGVGDGLLGETIEGPDARVVERRINLPLSIADGLQSAFCDDVGRLGGCEVFDH